MKFHCFKTAFAIVVSSCVLLAGCGGGGDSPGQPLPIDDSAPAAYTVEYLNDHRDLLVQPEHLIIAKLDPSVPQLAQQTARLHIRESMTLSMGSGEDTAAPEVSIRDAAGVVQLTTGPGQTDAKATLAPGQYELMFKANSALTAPQTLFLKLADTPTQATQRQQVGTGELGAIGASPPPLGQVTTNECFNCDFDGADLTGEDFTDNFLGGSTFRGSILTNANFTRTYCYQCTFSVPSEPGTLNFTDAILDSATVCCNLHNVVFSGALLNGAKVQGDLLAANFSPSTSKRTSMQGANLSQALLYHANIQYVDFTGAELGSQRVFYNAPPGKEDFVGVTFDNATPSNVWTQFNFAGMDLAGTSFTGIDLSQSDLSASSGTRITPSGLAKAILTNGTSGVDLSGQDFGTGFSSWAGSSDGTTPGADLRGVNLSNANLFQADLTGVNLGGAILIGADLSGSSLYRAKLVGAQLGVSPDNGAATAANLSSAYMPLADLTDADLRSVKFDKAHIYGEVKFLRARLDSASMISTNLAGADFTQASLADTNMTMAVLVGATFSGADLQNATMDGTYVQGASFVNTVGVAGLSLYDAYVALSDGDWSFTEADGTPFVIDYHATALGDVASTSKGTAICPDGEEGPCAGAKLAPSTGVPYPPPPPQCIPSPPDYDNCLPPSSLQPTNQTPARRQ